VADHETTTGTLAWAVHALVHRPYQLRAAQHAASTGATDYLTAVAKGTLRLRPVAAVVTRMVAELLDLPPGRSKPEQPRVSPRAESRRARHCDHQNLTVAVPLSNKRAGPVLECVDQVVKGSRLTQRNYPPPRSLMSDWQSFFRPSRHSTQPNEEAMSILRRRMQTTSKEINR
jgi:hypothetical protein